MAFLNRTSPPALFTLVVIAGMPALTQNIFLPSLPIMADWFDVPYGVIQQSVSLYLALSALLQLFIGPLSDRYGRRPVLLGALVLFLLATLGTLLATTAGWFLAFRMMQAVIATGMVLSRAIVRDMVDGPRAASMIGYVTMGMSVVPMIGPSIGGLLADSYGWKASFIFLGAAGLATLALVWADLGETKTPSRISLWAQFGQYPALLGSGKFWLYAGLTSFSTGSFFAALGGAPYVGSDVFGLTPPMVGAYFALIAIGYAGGNFLAGRFSMRVGITGMLLIGTSISLGGMVLLLILSLANLSSALGFFGILMLLGLGNGIALPSGNAGVLSVRPDLAGAASGLSGAIMLTGGAALAALAGVLLTDGASELPLIALMLGSAIGAMGLVLALIRSERHQRQIP